MKTFDTWLEMTAPPHSDADYTEWEKWYAAMEPLIKDSSLEELATTGSLTIRGMEKRAGVSEGLASFLVREFLKKHHSPEHVRVAAGLADKKRAEEHAALKDEYLYHVTTKRRLPLIRKNGLSPNAPSQFSNYSGYSKGKIFFCEKAGIEFWKERVEQHESHNQERPSRVVVLRIARTALEDQIQNDGIGTDDSGSPSYYVTQKVPAKLLTVVTPGS